MIPPAFGGRFVTSVPPLGIGPKLWNAFPVGLVKSVVAMLVLYVYAVVDEKWSCPLAVKLSEPQ